MHSPQRFLIPVLILLLGAAAIAAWFLWPWQAAAADETLQASGVVEAVEVLVSAETAGRVLEVPVQTGDSVAAGDVLLRLDDDLLQSQRQRATAALESAQAGLRSAQAGVDSAQAAVEMARSHQENADLAVDSAQLQHEIQVQSAREAEAPARTTAWEQDVPSLFSLPVWYFEQDEEIHAAQVELDDAARVLEIERTDYQSVLDKTSSADLRAAEQRLAEARAAFLAAEDVLDRAKDQSDRELRDAAQKAYDASENELEAAQSDYDSLLSDEDAQDVLDARARFVVAQERYDTAYDRYQALLTGTHSLQVRASELAVQQARASSRAAQAGLTQAEKAFTQAQVALEQAEKGVAQAEAELGVLDVQISKLVVQAPVDGVIMTRSIEPGEVVQPGAAALVIGRLDNLTITVYVPEDRYGEITLGMPATVRADSFPGIAFPATVTRIADQAEFTPRNVQTEEGRRTTVFAIELAVTNQDDRLKPGMPADVSFGG